MAISDEKSVILADKLQAAARTAFKRFTGREPDETNPVVKGFIYGYAMALTELPREMILGYEPKPDN